MAKRKQLWHPDDVRQKIQASQLINRLHDHAFGKVDMTPTQVDAAKTLLKKAVPDLASVAHTGADGGPLTVEIIRFANPTT
jgi:hypothetical protein